jgi:hypothetical protein
VGNATFLDLEPPTLADNLLPAHLLLRVAPSDDGTLAVARLNDVWLRKLLRKKPRSIRHAFPDGTKGVLVLTDSSQALQRFLRRHGSKPEAFTVTTFSRYGGKQWPAEGLKQTVREMVDALDFADLKAKLGKDDVFIVADEIRNHTSEPIDTPLMASVLRHRLLAASGSGVMNLICFMHPDIAGELASRYADAELSGEILGGERADADQAPAPCVLRLTLRDRQGVVSRESERPLSRVEGGP